MKCVLIRIFQTQVHLFLWTWVCKYTYIRSHGDPQIHSKAGFMNRCELWANNYAFRRFNLILLHWFESQMYLRKIPWGLEKQQQAWPHVYKFLVGQCMLIYSFSSCPLFVAGSPPPPHRFLLWWTPAYGGAEHLALHLFPKTDKQQSYNIISLFQVRLRTEVLCTRSSTRPGFELMTVHFISLRRLL